MASLSKKSKAIAGALFIVKATNVLTLICAIPDGYELADYDWELDSLNDGCWSEWQYPDSVSEAERAEIEAAWDENGTKAWKTWAGATMTLSIISRSIEVGEPGHRGRVLSVG
jgi:hypothetical protein